MEQKTRNLFLALELLALTVAGLLILIDYKLKRDLLTLFARIEKAMEYAQESGRGANSGSADIDSVYPRNMVADASGVEAVRTDAANSANGTAATATGNRPSPKRSRGNGNRTIPQPDKSVGT